MGLGKTAQSIALLGHLIDNEEHGPFLIVAPLSLLDNWAEELERFCPSLKTLEYWGPRETREKIREKIVKHIMGLPAKQRVSPSLTDRAIRACPSIASSQPTKSFSST